MTPKEYEILAADCQAQARLRRGKLRRAFRATADYLAAKAIEARRAETLGSSDLLKPLPKGTPMTPHKIEELVEHPILFNDLTPSKFKLKVRKPSLRIARQALSKDDSND